MFNIDKLRFDYYKPLNELFNDIQILDALYGKIWVKNYDVLFKQFNDSSGISLFCDYEKVWVILEKHYLTTDLYKKRYKRNVRHIVNNHINNIVSTYIKKHFNLDVSIYRIPY